MANHDLLQITSADQEALDRVYRDLTPTLAATKKLAAENTQTFTLGDDERFRATVFTPKDPSGDVSVHLEEFMLDRNPAGIIRALGAQALIPGLTIIYVSNDRYRSDNMNFSRDERNQLRNGDFEPYVRRVEAVTGQMSGYNDGRYMLFGPSQGAVVASGYAAHPESRVDAMTIVEAPNVADRTGWDARDLVYQFLTNGGNQKNVIAENYARVKNIEGVTIGQELHDDLTVSGGVKYIAGGLVRPANWALVPSMFKATLQDQLEVSLKNGVAVVHAYTPGPGVSPGEKNIEIAQHLYDLGTGLFESHAFEGHDHSLTNHNEYMAKLAFRASQYEAA